MVERKTRRLLSKLRYSDALLARRRMGGASEGLEDCSRQVADELSLGRCMARTAARRTRARPKQAGRHAGGVDCRAGWPTNAPRWRLLLDSHELRRVQPRRGGG